MMISAACHRDMFDAIYYSCEKCVRSYAAWGLLNTPTNMDSHARYRRNGAGTHEADTPLLFAIRMQRVDIVKLLVDQLHADKSLTSKEVRTPLQVSLKE